MKYGTLYSLCLIFLSALLTVSASAQTSDEELEGEDGFYIEVIDVNVVNLDVVVTDKKGNRISGLKKEDFELYIDKKPHAITNFYAVNNGRVVTEGGLELLPEPQRRIQIPGEEPELPEDQRLHLIVYVDNFNLHPFSRNRALGATRTFLRSRLRPGDEVMLVSYDRSLHVRHPFTKDPELIASALYELEDLSAHAVHFDSDRRDILDAIYEAEDLYTIRGRATQYASSLYNDLSFTLKALKELVETLAGLPGRKAILYVSDGLSMRTGEDIFYALNDRFADSSVLSETFRFDATRDFQELTQMANANRVTFYTLEAAGLRTYSYYDASNFQANGGVLVDQVHFSNLQHSLHYLADTTGGFAIVNTNNFNPMLDRMADDFGNYYSLGFSPAGNSGRYRRTDVKIEGRKDLRVRVRDGFRDKAPETRMSEGTMAALHYGYQQNPLGVQLEIGQEQRQGDSKHFLVPIMVRIPIGELNFLPQEEVQRGRIRLFVAAKDSEGGLAPVQQLPVPIDIPQADFAEAATKYFPYQLTLEMRRGRQIVAIGVRDEIGSITSFVTRGVNIGS